VAKSKIDFDDIMSLAEQRKADNVSWEQSQDRVERTAPVTEPKIKVTTPKIKAEKVEAKSVGKVRKIFRKSSSPYSSQQWDYIEEIDGVTPKYDFTIKDEDFEPKKVTGEFGWDVQGNKRTLAEMFSEI
jgi:hypothetical protein